MLEGVSIEALTWNMGNKPASKNAVQDIFSQLQNASPTVLSVSTQEELAPNGKRLVDLLKKELEKDGSQYEIIETYHSTMAGANNSKKTLFKALTSDQNRVSTAVLVKKPYTLENAETRIDYQANYSAKEGTQDKNKKVNKSVITVQGKLTVGGQPVMDISVSGGHFDANQDQKRRAHTNKFLKNSNMKNDKAKSFDEIYAEASAFKIVTGDFNERNQLFGSKKQAFDMMKQTNFKSYGFDIDEQPKMQEGNKRLMGTYGLNGIDDPDPKTQRKHVAKGGFLDRVAYTCGLEVKSKQHGFQVNPKHKSTNKKGKIFYHGSDHFPVLRSFDVTPPDPKEKASIVAAHILRRMPDFKSDIGHVKTLIANASDEAQLLKALDVLPLRPHDSEYSKEQYIRMYAGVGEKASFAEVVTGLQQKLNTLNAAEQSFNRIAAQVNSKPPNEKFLESVFNQINKCNDFKNALQEINDIPDKKMSKEDKAAIIQLAGKLVDDMYLSVGKRLNGEKTSIPTNLQLTKLLADYSNIPIVREFTKAKNQAAASLQRIEFAINPQQPTIPMPIQIPLPLVKKAQGPQESTTTTPPRIPRPLPVPPPRQGSTTSSLPPQRFESSTPKQPNPVDSSPSKPALTSMYSHVTNTGRGVQRESEPPKVEPGPTLNKPKQ